MILTGSTGSPFAVIELAIYKTLFTGHAPCAALTGEVEKACLDRDATNGTASPAGTKEKNTPVPPVKGGRGSLKAKEESEDGDTTNCKKIN